LFYIPVESLQKIRFLKKAENFKNATSLVGKTNLDLKWTSGNTIYLGDSKMVTRRRKQKACFLKKTLGETL
jgi:hypothetical protein